MRFKWRFCRYSIAAIGFHSLLPTTTGTEPPPPGTPRWGCLSSRDRFRGCQTLAVCPANRRAQLPPRTLGHLQGACPLAKCLSTREVPVHSRSACPLPKCLSTREVPVHSRSACPLAKCLSTREVPVHFRSAGPFEKCLSTREVPVHSRSACPLPKCLSTRVLRVMPASKRCDSLPRCVSTRREGGVRISDTRQTKTKAAP